jgi:hypothetical protein
MRSGIFPAIFLAAADFFFFSDQSMRNRGRGLVALLTPCVHLVVGSTTR